MRGGQGTISPVAKGYRERILSVAEGPEWNNPQKDSDSRDKPVHTEREEG